MPKLRLRFVVLAMALAAASTRAQRPEPETVRVAVVTDVHKDLVPDADERLQAFVEFATEERVDAIAQLGDFCYVEHRNVGFVEIFERFAGPRLHVIGNHDTDAGHTTAEVVAFWRMPARHYERDLGAFRFVALDANTRNDLGTQHPWKLDDAQLAWLTERLAALDRPAVVFTHQYLPTDISNFDAFRAIVAEHNASSDEKVIAVVAGHHHADLHQEIDGVHYLIINSASYFWVGPRFARKRFADDVHSKWPALVNTAPYRTPLWAVLELDPRGTIRVRGRESAWVGPSPRDLGYEVTTPGHEDKVVPRIRDRELRFPTQR